MKKASIIVGTIIVAVFGFWLLTVPAPSTEQPFVDQDEDFVAQPTVNGTEARVIPDAKAITQLQEQAEQHELQCNLSAALELYLQVKAARPHLVGVSMKIATCQAGVGKKEDAAKTLRQILGMESVASETLVQARAALQDLVLPKLSVEQQKAWKQALALIDAGEELKKQESQDLEVRIHHKLYAKPYHRAVDALTKLLTEVPEYAPAHLSLGVAHENLANFAEAEHAYRKYLDFGVKHGLRELDQQSQIRKRAEVCERRHDVDQQLAKKVPGQWEVLSADDGGVFGPWFSIELRPDGSAVRRGAGEATAADTWKLVSKQLVVQGNRGKPSEWYHAGQLVPSGNAFEGVTMDLRRVRYVKTVESITGALPAFHPPSHSLAGTTVMPPAPPPTPVLPDLPVFVEPQSPDISLPPTYGSVNLNAGFLPDPFTKKLVAGGSLRTNLGGVWTHVARAPDFKLYYNAGKWPLTIRTESSADTTLLVNLPNGDWVADDDSGGKLNPRLQFERPQSGRYDIYVGTYGPNLAEANLIITELGGSQLGGLMIRATVQGPGRGIRPSK